MSDWEEVSPENLAILRSCKPNERCLIYGDTFVKMTIDTLEEVMQTALRIAWADAEKNGAGHLGEIESFDVDDLELGNEFVRVVLRDAMGREASGIGFIPNPSAKH